MEGVKGKCKPSLGLRDTNEVDVVWHQTVGPDGYSVTQGVFMKPIEVAMVIGFDLKDGLVVVPPLDYMVRIANNGRAGETGHMDRLPPVDATGHRGDAETSQH